MHSSGVDNSLDDTSNSSSDKPSKSLKIKREERIREINNIKFLIAISEKNLEEVNSLMNKVDINYKDTDGFTPLHWAVETGDLKIIKKLLSNDVDLQCKNNDLETPFHIARQYKRFDIVKILDESLRARNESKILEIKNSSEWFRQSMTMSRDEEFAWIINPDYGYIYHLKILMLFLHRGLSWDYSFRLGIEIKEAKKFIDLVFEYDDENKKFYRLLHVKHKLDESKKITSDKLLTEIEGDYSLVKYFYLFQACKKDKFLKNGFIKDVIIYTNIDFDFDDLKAANIELDEVKEKDDIFNTECDEIMSSWYKFTTSMIKKLKCKLKPVISDIEIEDFLYHLIFAVKQPNEEKLKLVLKKEIGEEMGFLDTENAYNNLLIKMMDLSMDKEKCTFLSHEEGKNFFKDLQKEIPIWFHVQNPVSSFTGRFEDLETIHHALAQNSQVCISGMNGMGKTEIVRKYIADYADEYDNQIVWINAESFRSTVESFCELASDRLDINLKNSDGKNKPISSIVTDVYKIFSKNKSLFIFENAEKYENEEKFDCGIKEFLPCLPEDCVKPKVIIISQKQKWPSSITTIALNALKADEARELVEKMLRIEDDEENKLIDEFVEKLQFLPLALQQAIAYINMEKEELPCIQENFRISHYLKRYSEIQDQLLDFKFSEDSHNSYYKSVFATLNITSDALKQIENGQYALYILNIMSYFLSEDIPIELLLVFLPNRENLSAAIGLLKKYSIVSVQHMSISVHRLIQEVIRIILKKGNQEVKILENALKSFNKNNINRNNIEHIISMRKFASNHSQLLEDYSVLSYKLMSKLNKYGRIEEALVIHDQLLLLLQKYPNISYLRVAYLHAKNIAALCAFNKGQYEKALDEFEELIEIHENDPMSSRNHVLSIYQNIVMTLIRLGREKEAHGLSFELLYIYEADSTINDSEILLIKKNIVWLLTQDKNCKDALLLMKEIHEEEKRTLGDRHGETMNGKRNIAFFLENLQEYDKALKVLEEICTDEEATLPRNHPVNLKTRLDIARILGIQKKYDLALKICHEVLDIKYKKCVKYRKKENYLEVMEVNSRIVDLLKKQQKYEESLKISRKLFYMKKIIHGPGEPVTLLAQKDLVDLLLFNLERYSESTKLAKDLLAKQISAFGENHPLILITQRLIMMSLVHEQNINEAFKYSWAICHNSEVTYGENHRISLMDKRCAGIAYTWIENFDKALDILKEVLKVQEHVLGKKHKDCEKTRDNIATVLEAQTKFTKFQDNLANYKELWSMCGAIEKEEDIKTVLFTAVSNNDEHMLKYLVEDQEVGVFAIHETGYTLLHIAVYKCDLRFVKLLLENCQPTKLRDFVDFKTDSSNCTALHFAAKKNNFGIVKCLLKSQAKFCIKNKDEKMPIDLSTDRKVKYFLNLIHELFDNLKDADVIDIVEDLEELATDEFEAVTNTRNERGLTLAQAAMQCQRKDVATEILRMMKEIKTK